MGTGEEAQEEIEVIEAEVEAEVEPGEEAGPGGEEVASGLGESEEEAAEQPVEALLSSPPPPLPPSRTAATLIAAAAMVAAAPAAVAVATAGTSLPAEGLAAEEGSAGREAGGAHLSEEIAPKSKLCFNWHILSEVQHLGSNPKSQWI